MLRLTPAIQDLVESGGTAAQIRDRASSEGMRLMWQDGLEKARRHVTTVWELSKLRSITDESDRVQRRLAA